MRYQKPIDLWADNNTDKLITGELVLQPGQWVKCGNGPLSVYEGVHGLAVYVFHGSDSSQARKKYRRFVDIKRGVTV